MKKQSFLVLTVVLCMVMFSVVMSNAYAGGAIGQNSFQIAQGGPPNDGGPQKGKGPDFMNSEAGKKLRAAIDKYRDDPDFQKLMQEERKMRQEMRGSRDNDKKQIDAIKSEYQKKIDAATTQAEKDRLKKEMQQKIRAIMQQGRSQAQSKRKEMEKKSAALEKKYGSKFPDFFTAKKELQKYIESQMKNRKGNFNKSGSMGGPGQGGPGQGGNDPDRQKLMSIVQKYKDDPDFKKMQSEIRTARDSMRSKMQNSGDDPSQRRKAMQEFQSKMQEIEKKYGSKFPDYFEAVREMMKKRRGGGGNGGGRRR